MAKKSKLHNLWKNPKYIKQLNSIKLQFKLLSQFSLKCSIFAQMKKVSANVVFFLWWANSRDALTAHTLAMPLIFIFINYDLLEMRSELSDMIVRGNHPRTISSRFWLKWYSGFRRIFSNDFLFGENQPNFHIFVQKKTTKYKMLTRNL